MKYYVIKYKNLVLQTTRTVHVIAPTRAKAIKIVANITRHQRGVFMLTDCESVPVRKITN